MKARRARLADASAIHRLVAHYAAQGLLLPRTEVDIRASIGRFLVIEDNRGIVGCAALEPYGADLAEIRSLAVDPEIRGRGLGARLVQFALAEARRRKIARVFAVTHVPKFFSRQGFATTPRRALPEKIARDCCTCPKAPLCELVAAIITVCPEQVALPVLAATKSAAAL